MPLVKTPAILFRAHAYSETSRVLRFYTRDWGLVGVMARGVRAGASKGRGATDTFGEGVAVISIRENRDLHSLREFTPTRVRFGLAKDLQRLAGASVVSELILRHADQEPHPELFDLLSKGLDRLEATDIEALPGELLALAWGVVGALGFQPELEHCTRCGRLLGSTEMGRFDLSSGGIRCEECPGPDQSRRLGPEARHQVGRLLCGEVPAGLRKPRAHISLLDDFVTFHVLGGRRLESFVFLEPSPPKAPRVQD